MAVEQEARALKKISILQVHQQTLSGTTKLFASSEWQHLLNVLEALTVFSSADPQRTRAILLDCTHAGPGDRPCTSNVIGT